MAMTIFDAIIIYLAIGAAFAAHRLFHDPNATISYRSSAALFYFVLWLPLSIRAAIDAVRGRSPRSIKITNVAPADPYGERLTKIGTEMEKIVSKSVAVPVSEFRETFERYVGLRTQTKTDASQSPANETIFEVAGHENADLGVKCLNRRNRERLMFHQRIAANDFLRTVAAIADEFDANDRIRELSQELAVILKDDDTVEELKIYFSGKEHLPAWSTKPTIKQSQAMNGNLQV